MDILKKLLKVGIANKAIKYELKVDYSPTFYTRDGDYQQSQLGIVDLPLMNTLYGNLFPKEPNILTKDTPTKGKLIIVGYGDLILLALPGEIPSLEIFAPPDAEALFLGRWNEITKGPKDQAPLPEGLPPPPPQVVSSAIPKAGNIGAQVDFRESDPDYDGKEDDVERKSILQDMEDGEADIHTLKQSTSPTPITSDDPQDLEDYDATHYVSEGDYASVTDESHQSAYNEMAEGETDTPLPDNNANDLSSYHQESSIEHPFNNATSLDRDQNKEEYSLTPGEREEDSEAPPILPDLPYNRDIVTNYEAESNDVINTYDKDTLDRAEYNRDYKLPDSDENELPNDAVSEDSQTSYNDTTHYNSQEAPTSRLVEFPITSQDRVQKSIYYGPVLPEERIEVNTPHVIDSLLQKMIERGASDMHLTIGEPVCFRVDGDIIRLDETIVLQEKMERYLDPIIPPINKTEFIAKHDTDFAYEVADLGRFRVNLFRDIHGVGAVLRVIPTKVPTADQLNLPSAIRRFCEANKGLVVVTGPTGSGKSTTLASMIDLINQTQKKHIITIEDPIEFVHQPKSCLIRQRQVHRHTSSFSHALRAALREDPDIVLIGEMRDLETIEIALETAETGHLVFGTLHTNTAVSTINRIIDQFPTNSIEQIRTMLSDCLNGVIAQTLLKKRDGGRIAAYEILVLNHAVRSNIRESKTKMITSHMQTQKKDGNLLLNESLLELVKNNIVDPMEAYQKTEEKVEFLAMLERNKISLAKRE